MDSCGFSDNDLATRAGREWIAGWRPVIWPAIRRRIVVGIGQGRRNRYWLRQPPSDINYLSLSAAFAIPSRAHAASLSPPGAPLTATAPIVDSPTLIGSPPCALMVPGIVAGGAACPAGGGLTGPDGGLSSIV